MEVSRNDLKKVFVTDARPTQDDFWNLFDSFKHKNDKLSTFDIDGLAEYLNNELSQFLINVNSVVDTALQSHDTRFSEIEDDVKYLGNNKQNKLIEGKNIELVPNADGTVTINLTIDTTFFVISATKPATGEANKIYLILSDNGEDGNLYDEYVWINGKWEQVGSKKLDIDLSDYYKKDETDAKLLAKQDKLVSGENIVTINGQSVLTNENLNLTEEVEIEKFLSMCKIIGSSLVSGIEFTLNNLGSKTFIGSMVNTNTSLVPPPTRSLYIFDTATGLITSTSVLGSVTPFFEEAFYSIYDNRSIRKGYYKDGVLTYTTIYNTSSTSNIIGYSKQNNLFFYYSNSKLYSFDTLTNIPTEIDLGGFVISSQTKIYFFVSEGNILLVNENTDSLDLLCLYPDSSVKALGSFPTMNKEYKVFPLYCEQDGIEVLNVIRKVEAGKYELFTISSKIEEEISIASAYLEFDRIPDKIIPMPKYQNDHRYGYYSNVCLMVLDNKCAIFRLNSSKTVTGRYYNLEVSRFKVQDGTEAVNILDASFVPNEKVYLLTNRGLFLLAIGTPTTEYVPDIKTDMEMINNLENAGYQLTNIMPVRKGEIYLYNPSIKGSYLFKVVGKFLIKVERSNTKEFIIFAGAGYRIIPNNVHDENDNIWFMPYASKSYSEWGHVLMTFNKKYLRDSNGTWFNIENLISRMV